LQTLRRNIDTNTVKDGKLSEEAEINQGVRQGCIMSLVLLNIDLEDSVQAVRDKDMLHLK
jgi:hypothetical protein